MYQAGLRVLQQANGVQFAVFTAIAWVIMAVAWAEVAWADGDVTLAAAGEAATMAAAGTTSAAAVSRKMARLAAPRRSWLREFMDAFPPWFARAS